MPPGTVHGISGHLFTDRLPAEMPSGEYRDTPGDTRRPLAGRSAALHVVSDQLTGASLRALRQHPAEVAVLRPELDAPGVIRPGPAALRAGAGQLLIPSDPAIAAVGKVSHIAEANPGPVLPRGWTLLAGSEMRACGAPRTAAATWPSGHRRSSPGRSGAPSVLASGAPDSPDHRRRVHHRPARHRRHRLAGGPQATRVTLTSAAEAPSTSPILNAT